MHYFLFFNRIKEDPVSRNLQYLMLKVTLDVHKGLLFVNEDSQSHLITYIYHSKNHLCLFNNQFMMNELYIDWRDNHLFYNTCASFQRILRLNKDSIYFYYVNDNSLILYIDLCRYCWKKVDNIDLSTFD